MKFKTYKVIFRTWNTLEYFVTAEDEDDAVKTAEDELLIDLVNGDEYETMDVIQYTETSRDAE